MKDLHELIEIVKGSTIARCLECGSFGTHDDVFRPRDDRMDWECKRCEDENKTVVVRIADDGTP